MESSTAKKTFELFKSNYRKIIVKQSCLPFSCPIVTGGYHCVKSVQIRSLFWSVFSCIQSEYRKIRNRKNSVFGHFSRSACLVSCSLIKMERTDKLKKIMDKRKRRMGRENLKERIISVNNS